MTSPLTSLPQSQYKKYQQEGLVSQLGTLIVQGRNWQYKTSMQSKAENAQHGWHQWCRRTLPQIISAIKSTINSHAPLKQKTIARKDQPWCDKEELILKTKHRNAKGWTKQGLNTNISWKELHKTFIWYLFKGKRTHIMTKLDQKKNK